MTILLVLLAFFAPNDPETLSAQALELASRRQFAEAEKLWEKALQLSPAYFPAAFNLGYMHYTNGDMQKAVKNLHNAARIQPKDFNARYLLGAAYSQSGQVDDALRQWRVALQIQPEHARLMQLMAVEYGKGHYFREAAAVAERALKVSGGDPNAYLLAIKACQDAADHPAALRLAETMLRMFPDSARANFEFAYELHRAGRPSEGLPYLKKAMDADPNYEEPFFFLGETLTKEGRSEEAIEPLRKATALKPDYIAAWVALARALMNAGRVEEARDELLRAVQKDPDHPQPHLLLSQIYFKLGDEARAEEEKAISVRLRRSRPDAMESPQSRPFKP
jgi:Flp pilus assembly protein TadD